MKRGQHNVSRAEGAEKRIAELEEELREWEQSFDMYHDAVQRGTKIWQEATGRVEILPDLAELVAWLLNLVNRAADAPPEVTEEMVEAGLEAAQRWHFEARFARQLIKDVLRAALEARKEEK